MAHSEIGASSAYRWTVCPGSVGLIRRKGIKNATNEYAAEGTAAHELANRCFVNTADPAVYKGEKIVVICDVTKREFVFVVDDEMIEGVRAYRRAIIEAAKALEGEPPTLAVFDFKYGKGKPVEVRDNKQLKQYALGALLTGRVGSEVTFDMPEIHPLMFGTADFVFRNFEQYNEGRRLRQPEFVQYGIVQPRCDHPDGPVRTHTVDATDLIMYADNLKQAALATDDPNAPLVPGDHCDWCPAGRAGACPALNEKMNQAAKLLPWPKSTVSTVTPVFTGLTPEEVGERLKLIALAETGCAAFREFAYAEAARGVKIPGWKLVPKQARRHWKEATSDAHVSGVFVSRGLAADVYKPRDMKSPAQIDEILKEQTPGKSNSKLRESAMADLKSLWIAESSGLTLVPDSDGRQAVPVLAAKDIFQKQLPPPTTESK